MPMKKAEGPQISSVPFFVVVLNAFAQSSVQLYYSTETYSPPFLWKDKYSFLFYYLEHINTFLGH